MMTREMNVKDIARTPQIAVSGSWPCGFVTSSRWAGFIEVTDGVAYTSRGRVDLGEAFDVMLFSASCYERHMWDQRACAWTSVVLDDAAAEAQGLSRGLVGDRFVRGSITDVSAEWVQLHDGHAAVLSLPEAAFRYGGSKPSTGMRVSVKTVEYTSADEHGNVFVVAERPLFVVASTPTPVSDER